MALSDARWKSITPSSFSWEQDALNFIRDRLPDHDPWRVWSNFEFIALDGSISEVDLLVLSPLGLFLIEIKSWPGMLTGDVTTWTVEHEGRAYTHDNPLLLADRKAKRLASLLRRQKAVKDIRVPFVEPLVFLSNENMRCHLRDVARTRVTVRDREKPSAAYPPGITAALTRRAFDGAHTTPRVQIDRPVAKAIALAMEQAGIREANRMRRVGDYGLVELLFDPQGGLYQDWRGEHVRTKESRYVRLYTVSGTASRDARDIALRAANREYDVVKVMTHPAIPPVETPIQHDLGTALLFRVRKNSIRLDHLLAQRGPALSLDFRLSIVRQVAESMKYAHEKKIYHRALSPQSILISNAESSSPEIQIMNWQASYRDGSGSTSRVSATQHLEDLIEAMSMAYVAPESLSDPKADGVKLDAFSLGAVAYHVFSGKPPAESSLELIDRIREGAGLRISSVLDGAGEALQELVRLSTHPDVDRRPDSIGEWLALLESVEDELTTPADDTIANPLDARQNDKLPGGYRVKRRLGKGSTATAFLVEKDGREVVLKLANSPDRNDRVKAEAETIKRLRHANIAEWFDTVEMKGIAGFTMEYAGERDPKKDTRDLDASLADRIRKEGALQLELLERFGEDLLKAVTYLEQQGIAHRDIKPENIGIGPGTKRERLHLILFDFSLSRAPLTEIHAGTPPYLDPYLVERRRWDSHAERYSAAMTLYEMATGATPSVEGNPSAMAVEIPIDAERFDAVLRERFTAFFHRAFARDVRKRFDNAEEMLTAWRDLFKGVDQPANPSITREGFDIAAAVVAATLQTSILEFALSARAVNALDRLSIRTVEELLRYRIGRLHTQRGVGTKTRREILELTDRLRARFPDVRQASDVPAPLAPGDELSDPEVGSIDAIAAQLRGRPREQEKVERKIANQFLGIDGTPTKGVLRWKTQTEIARERGVTRANISAAVGKGRERWRKSASVRSVREDLIALLDANGGVLTLREAATALLTARGSIEVEPLRSVHASAVLRAAVEAEMTAAEPRYFDRRDGDRIIIARTADLSDLADRLGKAADSLARQEPLASPARVVDALRRIVASRNVELPPGVQPMTEGRLTKLAVESSSWAALSSKGEIYPKRMDAERALTLASGALFGAQKLTLQELQDRVSSRYPDAAPLPQRPRLDTILSSLNLSLEWSDEYQVYVYTRRDLETRMSPSSTSATFPPAGTLEPGSPESVDASLFEQRLRYSLKQGGFLVLMTKPKRLAAAERKLAARFDIKPRSLDRIVIETLHETADANDVSWTVVVRADGAAPQSTDRNNLQTLVSRSRESIAARMSEDEKALFSSPGLLARYDRMDLLEELRDKAGTQGSRVKTAWVLIATDGQSTMPVIDGKPVPVIGASQWARIPDAWLEGVTDGT